MKKSCIFVLLSLLLLTASCTPDSFEPEEGVWYCPELNIQLSYESGIPSYIVVEGETVICACGSDRGVDRILLYCQQQGHPQYHMGQLLFSAQVLELTREELTVSVDSPDNRYVFRRTDNP